ncbi:hypothetical protein BJ741DRAFT_607939 [Chytriomyces cf. hyalinus JEL632]|nr:hypothetical protein BJ741DRAFT_607939 [Chytriomyces cf. hyalinus JEL632]
MKALKPLRIVTMAPSSYLNTMHVDPFPCLSTPIPPVSNAAFNSNCVDLDQLHLNAFVSPITPVAYTSSLNLNAAFFEAGSSSHFMPSLFDYHGSNNNALSESTNWDLNLLDATMSPMNYSFNGIPFYNSHLDLETPTNPDPQHTLFNEYMQHQRAQPSTAPIEHTVPRCAAAGSRRHECPYVATCSGVSFDSLQELKLHTQQLHKSALRKSRVRATATQPYPVVAVTNRSTTTTTCKNAALVPMSSSLSLSTSSPGSACAGSSWTQQQQLADLQQDFTQPRGFEPAKQTTTAEKSTTSLPRPYKCTYPGCPKAFSQPSNLRTHMCTHTGERKHKCSFPSCENTYTTSNRLKIHMRQHTGERPYACDFPGCGYAAKQACSLSQHKVRHLSGVEKKAELSKAVRSVPCGVCLKKYRNWGSLETHYWREHGTAPPPPSNQGNAAV